MPEISSFNYIYSDAEDLVEEIKVSFEDWYDAVSKVSTPRKTSSGNFGKRWDSSSNVQNLLEDISSQLKMSRIEITDDQLFSSPFYVSVTRFVFEHSYEGLKAVSYALEDEVVRNHRDRKIELEKVTALFPPDNNKRSAWVDVVNRIRYQLIDMQQEFEDETMRSVDLNVSNALKLVYLSANGTLPEALSVQIDTNLSLIDNPNNKKEYLTTVLNQLRSDRSKLKGRNASNYERERFRVLGGEIDRLQKEYGPTILASD